MRRPLLGLLAVSACQVSSGSGPGSEELDPNAPKFYGEVEPILQARCDRCHRPGGAGPIDFTDYESAKPWAAMIARETTERRMPPWGAFETDQCKPRFGWADDERLSEAELDVLARWAQGGAQAGDKQRAHALPTFPSTEVQNPDLVLEPQAAYTVHGPNDGFRCFSIDPHLTETRFVQAAQVLPGNTEVVHHVIVFTDPGRNSDALMGPEGAYDCFGGPGFGDTQVLLAWAPGANALQLEPGVGFRLERESKLVVQVHYHPSKPEHAPDLTRVQIAFAEGRPDWVLTTALIGNFDKAGDPESGELLPGMNDRDSVEFRIPAGAQQHEERLRFKLPEKIDNQPIPELRIAFVGTHMHYVGTGMRVELERAAPVAEEPSAECLVETPRWDFRWQRGYAYDVALASAPRFNPGDTLVMTCKYDNSMSNPFVVDALAQQNKSSPEDVWLGEETLDEMCLAVLGVAFENPF
ncbi:MAG: hypothetical protein HY791_38095 [Deltaproteobacteria bacterium]|nr:hypothetical protein [Deltaproteobacteria bacterium]